MSLEKKYECKQNLEYSEYFSSHESMMVSSHEIDVLVQPYRVAIKPKHHPFVIFFDDSPENFRGKPTREILGLIVPIPVTTQVPQDLSNSARKYWEMNNMDAVFTGSGLISSTFNTLCNIIKKDDSLIEGIFFDWDKTLSVFRSIRIDTINMSGAAECYFGGKNRMKAIKSLFRCAKKHNVPISIFTANRTVTIYTKEFRNLLKKVDGHSISIYFTQGPKLNIL